MFSGIFAIMSLGAAFKLKSAQGSPFLVELCMFCQKSLSSPESSTNFGRSKKRNVSDYQQFIDACQKHHDYQTGLYTKLHETIKHKTAIDLLSSGSTIIHRVGKCLTEMLIIYREEKKRRNGRQKKPQKLCRKKEGCKLDRRLILLTLYYVIFCQECDNEQLHNIMQDSMDYELKLAFEECSSSLEIFRIRWEGAFDAMAREIKYHRRCWNKYIQDRVPESTKSNTSVPSLCLRLKRQ